MTTLTVEGTYDNGVVRLDHPLPLKEHERVRVRVELASNWVKRTSGLIPCSDPEIVRFCALDPSLEYDDSDDE
jgi:predicted DNA-binding antitoxin AbrB/MazE fold protein